MSSLIMENPEAEEVVVAEVEAVALRPRGERVGVSKFKIRRLTSHMRSSPSSTLML
jgi:hypothetical protein